MPVEYYVSFVAHWFTDAAIIWWETLDYTYNSKGIDWETFDNFFRESYFNVHHRQAIANEFEFLHQRDMIVIKCYKHFMELA